MLKNVNLLCKREFDDSQISCPVRHPFDNHEYPFQEFEDYFELGSLEHPHQRFDIYYTSEEMKFRCFNAENLGSVGQWAAKLPAIKLSE